MCRQSCCQQIHIRPKAGRVFCVAARDHDALTNTDADKASKPYGTAELATEVRSVVIQEVVLK